MRKKGHGLTLNGKIRKVRPCLQVFSNIRPECLECNTKKCVFGQDGLLWRCSSEHPEVSELPVSSSHPVRPQKTIGIWHEHGLVKGYEYNDRGERLYELPPQNQRPTKQQGQRGRLSERRQYSPFTSHAANKVHHGP